ncbi:MAG TPA: peptidase M20 [Eggerthellaceae bacterium]|nr:peptidase M20 [Eggerthellaceae bacterium]
MDDALQRDIDAYLDEHWEDVVADIDSLVRVESVEDLDAAREGAPYGPGPRQALSRALEIADRMGLQTHDCEGYLGYADLPGESETQIGIIGHVDVVPAGTGWRFEPYAVSRRDGYLLGRGVVDDKGPIMVALHAVKFWADRGQVLPYTVRVLFGSNEETNMKDVGYYRAHYEDPAFLFTPDSQFPVGYGESGICSGSLESPCFEGGDILEFSGGQAVNAVPAAAQALVRCNGIPQASEGVVVESCGNGLFRVQAAGVAAHASTPELGRNAIGVLVDYLRTCQLGTPEEKRFLELMHALFATDDGSGLGVACSDEHFGALTAVGGIAEMRDGRIVQSIDFRYPTTITSAEIERRVNEAAARAGARFAMEHDKEPFLMDPQSPAVRALLDAYNAATGEQREGVTSKGGTYARMFSVGVSFGVEKPWESDPDWVGGMHGPDEGVREDLLKQAFAIYARTIGNLMQLDLDEL